MDEFAEAAYFIIKYVDRFKTDITVGLECQKPLVGVIPNIGTPSKASDSYIEALDSKVNQMLDNYSRDGIRLLTNRFSQHNRINSKTVSSDMNVMS